MNDVVVSIIVSLIGGAALAQVVQRLLPSRDRKQDTVDSYYAAVLKERDYWRDEAQKKDVQIDALERQVSTALSDAASSKRESDFWQQQYDIVTKRS